MKRGITVTPTPDKDSPNKQTNKQTKTTKNYRALSHHEYRCNILHKISANRFCNIERITHHDPGPQGCNSVMHHIYRAKKKNHIIISIAGEKALYKSQHPFMIKSLRK